MFAAEGTGPKEQLHQSLNSKPQQLKRAIDELENIILYCRATQKHPAKCTHSVLSQEKKCPTATWCHPVTFLSTNQYLSLRFRGGNSL